ncbi:MAG: hypothetical protein JWN91_3956 [Nocardioides sp.]|nr:hypothetical protein [Nocardioides sp.]
MTTHLLEHALIDGVVVDGVSVEVVDGVIASVGFETGAGRLPQPLRQVGAPVVSRQDFVLPQPLPEPGEVRSRATSYKISERCPARVRASVRVSDTRRA